MGNPVRSTATIGSTDIDSTSSSRDVGLSITGVRKVFRRLGGAEVAAVDDISLDVSPGEMLVLLGPSGCGKTTLLRCIAGLERPAAGVIRSDGRTLFDGTKSVNLPPERRGVGMMFQSYALWPHMTVFDNVAYPLRAHRTPRRDIPDRVAGVLRMVGVEPLASQFPGQLSGGQQQRVALARSLVLGPHLILFDEPLSNVDAKVRDELRAELVVKQREIGFAGIYVTHDQEEALSLATRIAVLDSGKVAQLATPQEVYARPATRYVANFVGHANEVVGELESSSADGTVVVKTTFGPVRGRCAPQSKLGPGDKVVAIIRPESMRISTDAGENGFAGEVVGALFAGNHTTYTVETAQGRMRVWQSAGGGTASVAVGDRITCHADAERTWVLPEQDATKDVRAKEDLA